MKNRKAFNFYRSYYEVAKKLSVEDGHSFLMAILNKQFEDLEPKLDGIVDILYTSQKHSIDSQVEGYKSKIKSLQAPSLPPSEPPSLAPPEPPSLQEQGQGQGQGQEEEKGQAQEKEQAQDQEKDINIDIEADKILKKLQEKYERA
jgi:hypothetical protein